MPARKEPVRSPGRGRSCFPRRGCAGRPRTRRERRARRCARARRSASRLDGRRRLRAPRKRGRARRPPRSWPCASSSALAAPPFHGKNNSRERLILARSAEVRRLVVIDVKTQRGFHRRVRQAQGADELGSGDSDLLERGLHLRAVEQRDLDGGIDRQRLGQQLPRALRSDRAVVERLPAHVVSGARRHGLAHVLVAGVPRRRTPSARRETAGPKRACGARQIASSSATVGRTRIVMVVSRIVMMLVLVLVIGGFPAFLAGLLAVGIETRTQRRRCFRVERRCCVRIGWMVFPRFERCPHTAERQEPQRLHSEWRKCCDSFLHDDAVAFELVGLRHVGDRARRVLVPARILVAREPVAHLHDA